MKKLQNFSAFSSCYINTLTKKKGPVMTKTSSCCFVCSTKIAAIGKEIEKTKEITKITVVNNVVRLII